jgi:hypothetical protein
MTLTRQEIERALPANLKTAATDELTDLVNTIVSDDLVAEQIRNNFIGYAAVLKDGKFKTQDYLNAVVYVSYKVMGYSNLESYQRTFPQRHADLVAKGTSAKDIAAYVAAYHRGKLVNLIMEQSLVPTWVLNQDLYQKAINVQAELMTSANSEKVRTEAANSLLTHLKKPEVKEFQISVDTKESSGMNELRETLRQLAQKQSELIEGGTSTREIAGAKLLSPPTEVVEGEFTELGTDQTKSG